MNTRLDDLRVILTHMKEAEAKAIDSLARYKFQMFGYWAGVWVHLNKLVRDLGAPSEGNPFAFLVKQARSAKAHYDFAAGKAAADTRSTSEKGT